MAKSIRPSWRGGYQGGHASEPVPVPTGPGATSKPQSVYMFPELQGLPDEFRRLAAANKQIRAEDYWKGRYQGRADAYEQAAQMLEEKLNG